MASLTFYAVAKFLAYTAWCYLGLRWVDPDAATASSAFRLGTMRWMLGLGFGIAVGIGVGSIDPDAVARTYFVVYTPVRVLEWGIMAYIIASPLERRSPPWLVAAKRLPLWCLAGILVSFSTDLLSPAGLEGRFCVGRCLC